MDHACRNQVEEFTAQQRGKGLRVELLMPGPARAGTAPHPAHEAPPRPPAPDAEWFYLDLRPQPEEYAGRPPLRG